MKKLRELDSAALRAVTGAWTPTLPTKMPPGSRCPECTIQHKPGDDACPYCVIRKPIIKPHR